MNSIACTHWLLRNAFYHKPPSFDRIWYIFIPSETDLTFNQWSPCSVSLHSALVGSCRRPCSGPVGRTAPFAPTAFSTQALFQQWLLCLLYTSQDILVHLRKGKAQACTLIRHRVGVRKAVWFKRDVLPVELCTGEMCIRDRYTMKGCLSRPM